MRYVQGSVVKKDTCPYIVKNSSDILKKKTRVFDIFNPDKKCCIKIKIESSPSSGDMEQDKFSGNKQVHCFKMWFEYKPGGGWGLTTGIKISYY